MVFDNSALMAADEHTPSVLQSVSNHGRAENEILHTMTLNKTNHENQNVLPKFRLRSAVVSSDVEANSLVYCHDSEDLLSLTMQEQQQTRTRSLKLSRIASHDSDEIFNERKSVDRIPTRANSAALQACLRTDLRPTAPRSSTTPSRR